MKFEMTAKQKHGSIAWHERGPSENPHCVPVVFLHAMAGSATAWAPQIEALGAEFRCIAWDMPGFGNSDELGEAADISDIVACLAAFLTGPLALESAHLVGLSVGGMILQHFAAARPELCRSITLLDCSPQFGFGEDIKPSDFADPILAQLKAGASVDEFSDAMVRAIVGPSCSESIKLQAVAAMARARISGLALTTRLIADHDAIGVLGDISCPTLVMAGEHDAETPPSYAYEIARRIHNASVTIIPDAGHIVNLENPDAVTERLRFFLRHTL